MTAASKSPVLQSCMDQFVRSLGHLILTKVDPEAARRRNLRGAPLDAAASGQDAAHVGARPCSRDSLDGRADYGA